MKPYRFKLQTVLDYRAEQLNQIQQKLAIEEQKRLKILQRIAEYDAFIAQAFRDQQQALTEAVLDTPRVQDFPHFLWRFKQNRFQEHQALQAQEQIILQIRDELKQALIKQKSLEVLKDKDQTRYRQKIEKTEQEFLEELTLNRMNRQGTA